MIYSKYLFKELYLDTDRFPDSGYIIKWARRYYGSFASYEDTIMISSKMNKFIITMRLCDIYNHRHQSFPF